LVRSSFFTLFDMNSVISLISFVRTAHASGIKN